MADRTVRYPPGLRQRAVRLVAESRPDHATRVARHALGGPRIEHRLDRDGAHVVRKAESDSGARPGVTKEESAELRRLRAENRELRRANDILMAAAGFFAAKLDRPQRTS